MGLFGKLFGKGEPKEKHPRMVSNQYLVEKNGLFTQLFDFWGDTITVNIDRTDWEDELSIRKTNQVIDWLNVNQFRIENYLSKLKKSSDEIKAVKVTKTISEVTLQNGEIVVLKDDFTIQ